MESNFNGAGFRMSGNTSADSTLLITDIFDLFPSSFSRLIPLLEKRFRIVSYSDSGFDAFNRTRQLRHQTMHGYVADLIASLQEKGIQNITYLAHSVNAMTAFQAAVQQPDIFEKIVLLSAIPYLERDLALQYEYAPDMNADDNILFDNMIQTQMNVDGGSEQLHNLLSRSFNRMGIEKAKLIFRLLLTTDSRNCLDQLTIPVMILQGIGDKTATSETAYSMHRRIPDSYIIKIRAKGHLPQVSAPEEVCKAMEIFMHPAVC